MNAHAGAIEKAVGGGKRGLKLSPVAGSLPVLQYCAPEQLLIDESYQRSLENENSVTLIRKIAAGWDWGLCQPLFVAHRGDGGLYVVDGQHRLAAAVMRGDIPQLPCVVAHFDSATSEAAAFVKLNQQRRPLNAIDLFKAALASGDPDALKIVDCLEKAGLKLANHMNNQAMKPGQVGNVGGLQRTLGVYGEHVLELSLKVLAQAYPQQILRYAGSIFPGIVVVVAGEIHNRTSPDEIIEGLSSLIARNAQQAWYRKFHQAVADDPSLKRREIAEKVIRGAWVEWRQAQAGKPGNGGARQEPVAGTPDTFLKPAETAWCEQCERRVSGRVAGQCASPFCKLKVQAA